MVRWIETIGKNVWILGVTRTLYYLIILFGLLWIYGIADNTPPSTFIYNEF